MFNHSILPTNQTENQLANLSDRLGVYIHIPYCLQRCTYCDFATYVHTEILDSAKYTELVKKEIQMNKNLFAPQYLQTIYFGGGTPSLIPADHLKDIIKTLEHFGYKTDQQTEITIEINPATVDEQKLNHYLEMGVNRFSVGAQTFSDRLLKMVNREHNSQQTFETLKLLRKYNLNYSFDLLFALPTQTLKELKYDLDLASDLGMKHLSPYCLTVPEGHPLSKNRPLDTEQLDMFQLIDDFLVAKNFYQYEISNYSLPGCESKHNLLYWTDKSYWGLGLSAHSYSKKSDWGTRFWNPSNINLYEKMIKEGTFVFDENSSETLLFHQSLTDFCHTSLRLKNGLSKKLILNKFGPGALAKIEVLSLKLIDQGLVQFSNDCYSLTRKGIYISNQIFEVFTFLKSDF